MITDFTFTNHLPVYNSSAIDDFYYNENDRVLVIDFVNNSYAAYDNFLPSTWAELVKTVDEGGSSGRFYNAYIKSQHTGLEISQYVDFTLDDSNTVKVEDVAPAQDVTVTAATGESLFTVNYEYVTVTNDFEQVSAKSADEALVKFNQSVVNVEGETLKIKSITQHFS